jgi:RNA polymerase sigma-70 factor (ECF subfamily)
MPRDRVPPRVPLSTAAIDPRDLAKHRPQLLKFAMRELRNAAQAEDVVQETLLAGLQSAGSFRGGASLSTWLTGILTHTIVDHYRRGRREISLADSGDSSTLATRKIWPLSCAP